MKLVTKGTKTLALVSLGVIGKLYVIGGENITPSYAVDGMAAVLDMKGFALVEIAEIVPSPIIGRLFSIVVISGIHYSSNASLNCSYNIFFCYPTTPQSHAHSQA